MFFQYFQLFIEMEVDSLVYRYFSQPFLALLQGGERCENFQNHLRLIMFGLYLRHKIFTDRTPIGAIVVIQRQTIVFLRHRQHFIGMRKRLGPLNYCNFDRGNISQQFLMFFAGNLFKLRGKQLHLIMLFRTTIKGKT